MRNTETTKSLCLDLLIALSGIGRITPLAGYGTDVSWAISDAISALKELKAENSQLKKDVQNAARFISARDSDQAS